MLRGIVIADIDKEASIKTLRFCAAWLKSIWPRATTILDEPSSMPGWKTARLQFVFLVPLIGALAAILGIWVVALYQHEHKGILRETEREKVLMERMYLDDIDHNARMLNAVMEVIQRDAALRSAFAHRDRAALLRLASPLNEMLRHKFGVTHFYFSDPDRVNILRVHKPERDGDVIERITTLEAERTGTTSYGAELGPLGTFTLRLVTPWYEKGRLLGYVELGMEVDQVLRSVQTFTGMPVFVLISKQSLKREDWEAGMRMLGRTPTWDRFPDVVLNSQTTETMPAELAAQLADKSPAAEAPELHQGKAVYHAVFIPLTDASGRAVGRMVALVDVSKSLTSLRQEVLNGAAAGTLIAALLVGFFYQLVRRVGRRIERDEEVLQRLATHDGLTGLCNHRMFYVLLDEELLRAQRFHHPVSLLMLDIDHFKAVNDTHGHQAGDAILVALSELLNRGARTVDRVCRYGGEEISIILPETDVAAATVIAERLRVSIEAQAFDIKPDTPLHITVSIGLAAWPTHANTASTLVAAADEAMYGAKTSGRNRVVVHAPVGSAAQSDPAPGVKTSSAARSDSA